VRRTLFIRLSHPGPDASAACITRHSSGEFDAATRGPLSSLIETATSDDRIVLMLPAEDALVTSVDLPIRQRARLMQALPYALEEQLADDVDAMHFALGGKTPTGEHNVAAMRSERLAAYLAAFDESPARVDAAHIDAQLLPPDADQAAVLWIETDRILLRDRQQCAAVDEALLPIVMGRLGTDTPPRLLLVEGAARPDAALAGTAEERISNGLEHLARWSLQPHALNLLQGAFRPASEQSQWWRPWLTAAVLAGLLIGLGTIYQAVDLARQQAELTTLEQANIQTFRELFPAEQRIVEVRTQLEQQLRALQNPKGATGFLFLLDQTRQAFASGAEFTISELQFRDGTLFLSLEGDDLQALETLRGEFSKQSGVELEVLSANAASDGVKVRLRLSPVTSA